MPCALVDRVDTRVLKIRNLANAHLIQAQKFGVNDGEMSEEELGEDSVLLESPLDKLDPYTAFRGSLLSEYISATLELTHD